MKNLVLILIALCIDKSIEAQQTLVIEPAKPQAESSVTIHYNPKNTIFDGVKEFEATAYLIEGDHLEGALPLAVEIPLKEHNGSFTGNFRTNKNTKAFFIYLSKMEGGNLIYDNNNEKGYYYAIYTPSGTEVLGAKLALAEGYRDYYSIWRMKSNDSLAKEFIRKEFEDASSRVKFYNEYLSYLLHSENPADRELLKREVESRSKQKLREEDLTRLRSIYEALKENDKAKMVTESLQKQFPRGSWKMNEFVAQAMEEKNVEKRKELLKQFTREFTSSKTEYDIQLYRLNLSIALDYGHSAEYNKMEEYIKELKDKTKMANLYNQFATKLSGGGVTKIPVNVQKGLEFSQKALDLIQEEIIDQTSKPSYLTASEYKRKLNYTYHGYANIYAILLYHNNQQEKAYDLSKQAAEVFGGENLFINANYIQLTEKVKGAELAQRELEKFIANGQASPEMKQHLKSIFLKTDSEEKFAEYIGQLEKQSHAKVKTKLAKEMINIPAPDFNLRDLSGNYISLASLKGKVVVVDFWSTWCGPCIKSFPGMQKLVEQYKSRPDVVFLFIDTWETGDQREADVSKFIKDNKFSFIVLLDEAVKENPGKFVTVSDFRVKGIPTKFVIDKKGTIRFRSEGFNGSIDGLITEVTAMLELTNELNE